MTHAAVVTERIIADAGLAVTREQRRLIEQRVSIELVTSRREGAQARRNQDAAVVANRKLLFVGVKDQLVYRALHATEEAIRNGELPL